MASHGEPLNSSGIERMRLILIGKTGSGKSTTGNTILGVEQFKSQAGINSETKDCGVAIGIRNGREILVMDTPGLCDTDGDDDVIATRITQSLCNVAPGPHAIILVLRCDARFTEEEEKVFHMLKDMLGDKMTSYLIIIFVGKDNLDYDNTDFEEQLKQSKRLQGVLEQGGNRYLLFNNKGTEVEKAQMAEDLMQMVEQIVTENDKSCFEHKMADKVNKTMANMMKEEIQRMSEAMPAMREKNKPANPMLNDPAPSGRGTSLESDIPLTCPRKVAPKTKPKPTNPYRCVPDQTRRIGSETSSDFKGRGDFQGLAHAERETMHRKKDLCNLQKRGTVKKRRSLFEQPNPEPDVEDRRYNKPRTLPRRDFENQQPQTSETRWNLDKLYPQESAGAPHFGQAEIPWRKSTGSFQDDPTATSQDSVYSDNAAQKEKQDVYEDRSISSWQDVKTATSQDSVHSDDDEQNEKHEVHEDKTISSWQNVKTASSQDSVHSDNSEPDDEQDVQTATSHDSTSTDSSVQNSTRDVHEDRTISHWQDVKTATPQDAVHSDNSDPDDEQDVQTSISHDSDRSNINVQNETRDVNDDRALCSWQDVQAAASQDLVHSDINAQQDSQDGNEDRSIVLRQHVKTTMPRDIIHCSWIEKDMEEVLDKLEHQFVETLKCHNESGFNYEIPDKPKMTKVEQRRLVEDVLRKKINNPEELSKAQREQLGEIVKTVGQKIKEGKTKFNLNSIRKCSLM